MAENREKISNGPNARPVNEPVAGTAPGIPDEAVGPDEAREPDQDRPRRPGEEERDRD